MESIKKEIVTCLRQILEGNVSWDHFIEEFHRHKDADIAEVVELVESMSQKYDKYVQPKDLDEEEREKIEAVISKLEGPANKAL